MALRTLLVAQVAIGVAALITEPASSLAKQATDTGSHKIANTNDTRLDLRITDSGNSELPGVGALPPRADRTRLVKTTELKAKKPASASGKHDGHDHAGEKAGGGHGKDDGDDHEAKKPASASGKHDGHDHAGEKTGGGHGKDDGHDHGTKIPASASGKHDGHDHAGEKASGGHGKDDGHDHGTKKPASASGKHDGHDHAGEKAGGGHGKDDGHDHGAKKPASASGKHDGHDHAGEKAGGGHGKDDGHGHGGEGGHSDAVKLTNEQMKEFGVETEPVDGGSLAVSIVRPAEVQYDLDQFAHVVPRVAGIVRSVDVKQGDKVKTNDILAVLESRELADAKAGYLAAKERAALSKDNFDRERALKKKKITSEKAFFAARSEFAEARIALRLAEQKLHALGVDKKRLKQVETEPETDLTTYTMRAPLGGVVVSRHLVRGESVATDREAFVIADVSQVWVDISIYPKDLTRVSAGLPVRIETENGNGLVIVGKIAHVTPNVSEETRTAKARVVLDNDQMRLRPGMFVNAVIDISATDVAVRVPKSALQNHDGKEVVFVSESGKFEPRPVKLGRRNGQFVEVVSGLATGEIIAAKGSFVIKSQLSKESFGDGHNH